MSVAPPGGILSSPKNRLKVAIASSDEEEKLGFNDLPWAQARGVFGVIKLMYGSIGLQLESGEEGMTQ